MAHTLSQIVAIGVARKYFGNRETSRNRGEKEKGHSGPAAQPSPAPSASLTPGPLGTAGQQPTKQRAYLAGWPRQLGPAGRPSARGPSPRRGMATKPHRSPLTPGTYVSSPTLPFPPLFFFPNREQSRRGNPRGRARAPCRPIPSTRERTLGQAPRQRSGALRTAPPQANRAAHDVARCGPLPMTPWPSTFDRPNSKLRQPPSPHRAKGPKTLAQGR
jgi:hypothetical protein